MKRCLSQTLIAGFRRSDHQLSNNFEQYTNEVNSIIEKEIISDEERRQIKLMNLKSRILSFIKKIKILQWQAIEYHFMHRYIEEHSHRIFFDFSRKKFVINK